ncbi:hypothetical protein [Stutzerimonas nitrititolerans]|uniref:hypothetical protein n=1 Tax=Stutzerimonas nitrititolerans TaxID=2482751 RepID=UPI0028ACEAED|nr:hypothetical protein [Stutzerimonas nitrititolerans]
MSYLPTPSFSIVFSQFLKRVLHHWTPITVVLAFAGTTLGALNLYLYTQVIGRPDLFLPALDSRASLAAWLFIVLPILAGYLFILTSSGLLYGGCVSMLGRRRRHLGQAAQRLLLPVIAGSLALVVLIFFFSDRLGASESVAIVVMATVLGLVVTYALSTRFRLLVALVAGRERSWSKLFFLCYVAMLLVCTVLAATFSISLILASYIGEDTNDAVRFVATLSFFTQVLSLAPAFVFFTVRGSLYRRLAIGLTVAMLLFLAFFLVARGAASSVSYAAAGKLELRQTFTARFVLPSRIGLDDLDSLVWNTRLARDGRIEVVAYQLFEFGNVLLLCPGSLLKSELHRLPRYSRQCLKTSPEEVDRKPFRFGYSRTRDPVLWRAHADRLAGRDTAFRTEAVAR